MSEESTTSDLSELFRQSIEAVNRGELDAYLTFYAPDAVFQTGVGRFEGRDAIRGYLDDLWGSYDELVFALEELHNLGNGVAFSALTATGRLRGTRAEVHLRYAMVVTHVDGALARVTDYVNVDEARAAAEQLAEEKREAMSEAATTHDVVELVRGFFEALNRRDIDALMNFHTSDATWDASTTAAGAFEGAAAVKGFLTDWYSAFDDWSGEPEELRDLGNGVVFASVRWSGRPVGGDASVQARGALVFTVASHMITRVTVYTRFGIDEGRAAAERLAEERGEAVSRKSHDERRSSHATNEPGEVSAYF
jgi:ketosteroid isomerase-like protein